ncbi:MAG: penicillin acylase family protein [Caldilineaceae bacterium]|nr:penicillin acylase family protein [Caldilineaceae bacterium]
MSIQLAVVLVVVLLVLVALIGGFLFYIYWGLVQRPTPKASGAAHLPGLSRPVEVLLDKHGVPHIYAESQADLFYAQGYMHARDRLWQMEQNRRIAHGTLSEIFGESALEVDRFSRIIGFRRAAQVEAAQLDTETLAILEMYVAGINAYIAANPGRLAAEFNLVRLAPALWQVEDVVAHHKLWSWSLGVNWETELTRLQLMAKLGPIRAAELEPDYPGSAPIILEAAGDIEAMRLLSTAGLLLNEYEKIKQWVGQPVEGMGSNSWVIAPKHTQTRRAILCNDPHLALQIPGVWYENALHCPGFEASGVTYPGAPGVMIGHTAEIAWGLTNSFVDVQDLYVERAHADEPERFEYEGGWEDATVLEETIHIRRREAPHVERVVITRHGPLISNLIRDAESPPLPLALCWTGHQPGNGIRSVLKLNRAHDWDGFVEALADWGAAPQNVTFADADGNIGFLLAGMMPIRRQNLGLVPAPGWDGTHEWPGFVPAHELPRIYNPASGRIVTANNKIVGDDFSHFLGVDFVPGWRAARIEEMLAEKERFSLRDMEEMQLDTTSKFAALLTPFFAQLNSDDSFVKVALSYLRKWNYRLDAESTAGLVMHYALLCLLDEVYGNKIGDLRDPYMGIARSPIFLMNGFAHRATAKLLELLSSEVESPWYTDMETQRHRTRDEVLYAALAQAVELIRAELGDNARRWNWGRVHQVRYVHPLGSVRLFKGLFNRGPFPVGGDATTPNQTSHAPKLPPDLVQVTASYRQIYDVGLWDRAQTVTTSGQSGHPMSSNYADQIPMWLEGAYHPMPWSREAVRTAALNRIELLPMSA